MIVESIKSDIAAIISPKTKLKKDEIIRSLKTPPEGIEGDLAFPCYVLSKKLKKDPVAIAIELAQLKPKGMIKSIEANGPYLNFHFNWKVLGKKILTEIIKKKQRYGLDKEKGSVLIEHTSANPDGPLHLGHFRNMVIGDSLARIIKFSGKRVKTEFYVNNTGRQISLAAWYYLNFKSKPKGKPDWWVYDLYFKCNQRLKKYPSIENEVKDMIIQFEKKDPKLIKTYNFIVDKAIAGHKETLKRLNIKIDNFAKESKYLFDGSVNKIIESLIRKRHAKKDGKRIWVDLKKFGIEREFVLTRSDGTTIYPARDLAYHLDKFSRADENINILGTDHKFYAKQLLSTLNYLVPKKLEKFNFLFYEFLLLPEGTMSTRLGKFVSVDEVIDKFIDSAKKTIQEKNPKYTKAFKEKIANIVGIGALKYAMIKVSPEKTYSFSVEDSLNFEGNTAPYIQYTHARASSILKKAKSAPKIDSSELDSSEMALLYKLMDFPDAAKKSASLQRPHFITNYAHELATLFNNFYHSHPVIKADKNKGLRLALVKATKIVLSISLDLLGIEAPDKM